MKKHKDCYVCCPCGKEASLKIFILLLAFSGNIVEFTSAESTISSYTGKIGAGNYTYFALHEKGAITIVLESLVGDVDIYVSENVEKPSYMDYDLQSTTCGLDIVTVPKSYRRPVHIALFGHVYSGISRYKLTAIQDFEGAYEQTQKDVVSEHISTDNEDEEEETQSFKSLLWTIVVGILKIILEVVF